MDFTILGIAFIVGHLTSRVIREENDQKISDLLMTSIGVFLILGSRYSLFGG